MQFCAAAISSLSITIWFSSGTSGASVDRFPPGSTDSSTGTVGVGVGSGWEALSVLPQAVRHSSTQRNSERIKKLFFMMIKLLG